MPSCLIRGVRSVELATTNIEEAARFYENTWMLKPVETRNAARFFRGTAGYHHLLGLHIGVQPAVVRLVFDVADRKAIDALHKTIAAAGGKPSTPVRSRSAAAVTASAARIPTAAISLLSARPLITPTPRMSRTGRVRSCMSISTRAISTPA